MCILGLLGIFLFFQTECFISLFPLPYPRSEMARVMAADREKQRQVGERYEASEGKAPERGLNYHGLFRAEEKRRLESAVASLRGRDAFQEFQREFEQNFSVSFDEHFNAVFIPPWLPATEANHDQFKITTKGREAAEDGPLGSFFVKGFTVRDRTRDEWESTYNGTPRIAIYLYDFRSHEDLQLAIFHEMLHSLNVPGYYPCSLNITQTDLVYLPEYRAFVDRTRLNKFSLDKLIWIILFLVSLGFSTKLWDVVQYRRRMRSTA